MLPDGVRLSHAVVNAVRVYRAAASLLRRHSVPSTLAERLGVEREATTRQRWDVLVAQALAAQRPGATPPS